VEPGDFYISVFEGSNWSEYDNDGLMFEGTLTDNGDGTFTITETDMGEYGTAALSADGNTMTISQSDGIVFTYEKTDESALANVGEGSGNLFDEENDTLTLTLYADLSGGSEEEMGTTKDISLPLEGEPASPSLIAFTLADGLSEWIGLDFTLNDVTFGEDNVTVDWSADSTLIAGLDDREQSPDFGVYDAVALNWMMMDSLALTLKNNLDVSTVYYCSDGGPVTFTNPEDMALQGLPELPVDQAYEGSAFFVAHAGGQG
jgi:hypothetical protein